MDRYKIYMFLRINGLTPEGACALMGNLGAESDFKPDNVENRCTMTDEDYTYNVDHGFIWREQFIKDAFGYGLAQWTFWSRKAGLYDLAKAKGVSIGDENMQLEWLITELTRDYPAVYQYLCTTNNLKEATELVCKKYEQPAVNNIDKRLEIAKDCFVQLASNEGIPIDAILPDEQMNEDYCHSGSAEITVKVLSSGDKGRDVFLLQCGLTDMGFTCGVPDGDFGPLTMCAVNELRTELGLQPTGIADQEVWQALVA